MSHMCFFRWAAQLLASRASVRSKFQFFMHLTCDTRLQRPSDVERSRFLSRVHLMFGRTATEPWFSSDRVSNIVFERRMLDTLEFDYSFAGCEQSSRSLSRILSTFQFHAFSSMFIQVVR